METNPTSVGRTSSFRKRGLEERKGLDMEIEAISAKHERAPSASEMDSSLAPSKFIATSGSNTVMDEIEAHFLRSLAQSRHAQTNSSATPTSQLPPTTIPLITPSHPHRTPVVANTHNSSETKQGRVSPNRTHREKEAHEIVVTLNNHASLNHRNTPNITNGSHPIIKPIPKSTSLKTSRTKTSPVPVHTLPMVTMGGIMNSDPGANNQILSPVLTPQMVQQIMTQQSLAYLQQQQQQQQQTSPHKKPPALIQTTSPKGFQIIDLTKSGQNQRSQNILYLQKEGANGRGLVFTTPSGVPVLPASPMNIISNKATSLVTSTTTQPTPAVTSAYLSSHTPQMMGGLQQMMIPMMDPNNPQMITGGNQVVFLSQSSMPMVQQQPLVLMNPVDLATFQQLQPGMSPGVSVLSPGLTMSNQPGGYIMLSPGPNATSFAPPLINLAPASSAGQINGSPPLLKPVSPLSVAVRTRKPHPKAPPPLEPVVRRTSLESVSPGAEDNDNVMMTPASVEDHFAKALGEQWSKLQTAQT